MIDLDELGKYVAGAVFATVVFVVLWWFTRSDVRLALETANLAAVLAERCDGAAADIATTLNSLRIDTIHGPWGSLRTTE